MVELAREIKQAEERTKAFKMASREVFARERLALDKQYAIRDKMQEIDRRTNKVETKIEWIKERLFEAERRYEENLKMCQSLEDNRIDVPAFDDRMENIKNRFTTIVDKTAAKNKKIDVLRANVATAEKRELRAKMRLEHFEEILRSRERMRRIEPQPYQPKTDQEYLVTITKLRMRLSEAVRKFQAKEAKQAALEKKETEIEANIQHTKKKTMSVMQTRHEMSGTRM
ncbi:hypothetical protein QZH41_006802 [Actinostola sp. cb2023]|nr:hypothetical protein QZH41_006802 [Actinostola sp. cb2023]